jgi:PTS system ascorbate-specific IIA component
MSVGLLVVTHNRIGEELLAAAQGILGICPLNTAALAVSQDCDLQALGEHGSRILARLDTGAGVLILTDAFGSTPSNLAVQLGARERTAVVSGVNLPMLLRVLNYPGLDLAGMQRKAVSGGRDGVLMVQGVAGV